METNPPDFNLAKLQNNLENQNLYPDSYPIQVHFLMIDRCNVKCIMCGGDYFRSQSGWMITLEKFKIMATNLRFENVRAIVLAGAGGPLLNPDLVQIIQFLKEAHPHITISVTTNGLGLTEKLSGLLVDNGVNLVNISINSATRLTYRRIMQVDGFDRVCGNAKAFVELRNRSGKPITLQFSAAINRLNIEDLPRLVQLGKKIGINSLNLFYTRYYVGSTRNLDLRFSQHQPGKGSKYTSTRLPVQLVYYEEYYRVSDAYSREKQVQGWSRRKREALINGSPELLPILAKKVFNKSKIQEQSGG